MKRDEIPLSRGGGTRLGRGGGTRRDFLRTGMGGALAVTLAVGVMVGTFLPPRQAEAQPTVTFDSDAVLLFSFIKPSARADYEGIMQKLSDALQQSGNTEEDRKGQARGWKVYRAGADFSGQNMVPYVWFLDPVVRGANYSAATILNEVFPEDIEELFNTYNSSFTDGDLKQLPVNLQLVADF